MVTNLAGAADAMASSRVPRRQSRRVWAHDLLRWRLRVPEQHRASYERGEGRDLEHGPEAAGEVLTENSEADQDGHRVGDHGRGASRGQRVTALVGRLQHAGPER